VGIFARKEKVVVGSNINYVDFIGVVDIFYPKQFSGTVYLYTFLAF